MTCAEYQALITGKDFSTSTRAERSAVLQHDRVCTVCRAASVARVRAAWPTLSAEQKAQVLDCLYLSTLELREADDPEARP